MHMTIIGMKSRERWAGLEFHFRRYCQSELSKSKPSSGPGQQGHLHRLCNPSQVSVGVFVGIGADNLISLPWLEMTLKANQIKIRRQKDYNVR